jgi:hypothetical protein
MCGVLVIYNEIKLKVMESGGVVDLYVPYEWYLRKETVDKACM